MSILLKVCEQMWLYIVKKSARSVVIVAGACRRFSEALGGCVSFCLEYIQYRQQGFYIYEANFFLVPLLLVLLVLRH